MDFAVTVGKVASDSRPFDLFEFKLSEPWLHYARELVFHLTGR